MKPALTFIGAGKVGTSLAILFKAAGYPVLGIASRRTNSAEQAGALAGVPVLTAEEACRKTDILFITTSDREIPRVVEHLSTKQCYKNGQIIVHTSGAHPAALLSPAHKFGCRLLSFHPLQSFPPPSSALVNLRGTVFTLEGDAAVMDTARQLVRDLGGEPVIIQAAQKALYHAGACVASNYVVAVFHLALSLLQAAGFAPETARKALLPLLTGTTANLQKAWPAQALTGPISRGDMSTLSAHLASLNTQCPEFLDIYRQLAIYTVQVAWEKGTLNAEQLQRIKELCLSSSADQTP